MAPENMKETPEARRTVVGVKTFLNRLNNPAVKVIITRVAAWAPAKGYSS